MFAKIKQAAVTILRTIAALAAGLIGLWLFVVAGTVFLSQIYLYGTIRTGDRAISVFAQTGMMTEGLIAISNSQTDVSIILEPEEWDRLLGYWAAARGARSARRYVVGEVRETDTFDQTTIGVVGGPDVRFVIRENGACADFALTQSDEAQLDRALQQAARRLHDRPAPGDADPIPLDWQRRIALGGHLLTTSPRSYPSPVDTCSR
jgi:hypothetical protein